MKPSRFTLWQTFRAPLLVGVLSLAGLIGALLGDRAWDAAGAALLASPVVAAAWARLAAARR